LDKEKVLSLISDEHDLIMAIPFLYEGTRKIKVDFERDFLLLEDEIRFLGTCANKCGLLY